MNLHLLNLTVHILAAFVWIGGMLFLTLVAALALRGVEPSVRARVFSLVGRQFRWVGWVCIAVLIVTGIFNLRYYGVGLEQLTFASFWSTPFGSRLAIKGVLVVVMLALSALHDFMLGPRSIASATRPGSGSGARKLASWLARLNLVLGILVVAVAVELAR